MECIHFRFVRFLGVVLLRFSPPHCYFEIEATDGDTSFTTGSFALAGGADQSKFSLTASGVLTFLAAPVFASPVDADGDNEYHISVTVSDGENTSAPAAIVITVTECKKYFVIADFKNPVSARKSSFFMGQGNNIQKNQKNST